jgi:hypothetical protein
MYGKPMSHCPTASSPLTAEHVDLLRGSGDAPVTCQARAGRGRQAQGRFTSFRVDRILGLEPDLILAFSDLRPT